MLPRLHRPVSLQDRAPDFKIKVINELGNFRLLCKIVLYYCNEKSVIFPAFENVPASTKRGKTLACTDCVKIYRVPLPSSLQNNAEHFIFMSGFIW